MRYLFIIFVAFGKKKLDELKKLLDSVPKYRKGKEKNT